MRMGPVSQAVPGALLRQEHVMGAGRAGCAHAQPTAALTDIWESAAQELAVLHFSAS